MSTLWQGPQQGEWRLNKDLPLDTGPEGRWTVAPGDSPENRRRAGSPGCVGFLCVRNDKSRFFTEHRPCVFAASSAPTPLQGWPVPVPSPGCRPELLSNGPPGLKSDKANAYLSAITPAGVPG